MKKRGIVVVFALIFLVLNLSSCNRSKDKIEIDYIALTFDDYSEFVLFGTQGILDGEVAQDIYAWHFLPLVKDIFVDVRTVFLLPELPADYTEQVLIEYGERKFSYSVYSTDDSRRITTEYRVEVYPVREPNRIDEITAVGAFEDVINAEGVFKIQTEEFTILYAKGDIGYNDIYVIDDNVTVRFNFSQNELSPEQIEEKCGSIISALVSGDTDVALAAINQVIDFL